jgi:hypothetical protein
MELLILIALAWIALYRSRRRYIQHPPVIVNVMVVDADAARVQPILEHG